MTSQKDPEPKDRPAQILLKSDLKAELGSLLKSYGCSSTDDGWRRLAIQLALESGKLSATSAALEYTSHHDDSLPNNGLALIAEAVARPGMTKTAIAREALKAAKAIGIDRYSTPDALRVVLAKRDRAVEIALARSSLRAGRAPHLGAEQQLDAIELASRFPSKRVGQHRLDCWREDGLRAAAKAMTISRTGEYVLETSVPVSTDIKLNSVVIVDDAYDHPEGPPRGGAASSPVRVIFEINAVLSIPGDDGPLLHRYVGLEIIPPTRCKLEQDAWAWVGKLDDGTEVEIRGTFQAGAVPEVLEAEVVVRPPKNRSSRQHIRCVRRSNADAVDL